MLFDNEFGGNSRKRWHLCLAVPSPCHIFDRRFLFTNISMRYSQSNWSWIMSRFSNAALFFHHCVSKVQPPKYSPCCHTVCPYVGKPVGGNGVRELRASLCCFVEKQICRSFIPGLLLGKFA
ncbi:hypothetical protein ILYODFUR_037174 [Ilyodon furcidens]|uniref:Uncharacterized protein n=1 Tax=Ilyodon furcidens TaxID=33524 RepID=A0ABV0VK90_9TELE